MPTMPDAPSQPEPFTAPAATEGLEDLRARLRATRWPDAPEDAGWSLGTDLAYLRELVAYWADGFDWPAQEAMLARFPRFRVPARRPRHPLRTRPRRRPAAKPAAPRAAADPQPRLAGLVLALREGHPAANRPRRTRRRPRRRLRRGRTRHARLRLFRPPGRPAPRLHRGRRPVGPPHGHPRLRPVRRRGRGHWQPREPLPRPQLPRPGGGRSPYRRGRPVLPR